MLNISSRIGFIFSLILSFWLASGGYPQNLQKKIGENQKYLQKLKKEIFEYENKIASETKKEKSGIDKLNDINRKIGLLQQLVGSLEQERTLTESNIVELKVRLTQTTSDLQTLKKFTAQRLIQIYKHREEQPLAYVLTSDSWTQAYARVKYLKLIAHQDRLDLQLLRQKKEQIEIQKQEIEYELRREVAIIAEKKNEKKNLSAEMTRRKTVLGKIRKDKTLFQSLLEEKKDDLETLRALIAELEKKKREQEAAALERRKKMSTGSATYKEPVYEDQSTFGLFKGKLPYPVIGRIVQSYGDQINLTLGTKTRNPGVEIQAGLGAQVRAVAKGKITIISWLRRLGNTVIIDHGGGYYTVYAHLAEIYVIPDQSVTAGDAIASIDESEEGKSILHFEIYRNREAQDPAQWLK